jgi:tetratricopeptide (TPR) repeat protein
MEAHRAEMLGAGGRITEALQALEGVLEQAEALGDLEALYLVVSNAAEMAMLTGRLNDSLAYRRRDLDLTEKLGRVFEHAFALSNLAQIQLFRGEWDEARAYAVQALEASEELGMGFASRTARMNLGAIALAQGHLVEARTVLQQAAESTSGSLQVERYVQRGLAQLELKEGKVGEAVARLQPLVENGDPNDVDRVFLVPILALAMVMSGDVERGEMLARQVLDASEDALAAVDAWPALGLALSRQGRRDEAIGAFQEGASLAHRMPYPYAEATTLALWGTEEDSRERLEEALVLFRRLGARKDIEAVERYLAEMGR